jgi:tetratricopeptide (TPR) repeat protein
MKELTTEEMHWLREAEGWAELGNFNFAFEELDNIEATKRTHPLVLQVRSEVYVLAKHWDALIDISKVLIQVRPDHDKGWINCAFALHELKRTREALETLLPVVDKFPDNWCVPYNLACYACQLGEKKAAMKWLARAIDVAPDRDIRTRALNDPDLKPIEADIAEI